MAASNSTWAGSRLTLKNWTRQEWPVQDKHSSLFDAFFSYDEEILSHWPLLCFKMVGSLEMHHSKEGDTLGGNVLNYFCVIDAQVKKRCWRTGQLASLIYQTKGVTYALTNSVTNTKGKGRH